MDNASTEKSVRPLVVQSPNRGGSNRYTLKMSVVTELPTDRHLRLAEPFVAQSETEDNRTMKHHRVITLSRGRPWRYSVIPSTPDLPTKYQIRQHSNPAGLPTFAAIFRQDFRASVIRLTCPHV